MKLKTMAATAAVMMLSAGIAMAQPGPGGGQDNPMRAKMREACGADYQKFCAGKMGDRDAMRQCRKDNQDKFSDTCKTALKEMQAMRQQHEGGGDAKPN